MNRVIFLLGLAGLAVSLYLAYEYSLPTSITCPITGSGCDAVRNSPYSSILGIQIPYLGIIFYLSVMGLSVFNLRLLRLILTTFGLIFSIYLTGIEAFVLKAYCIWCLTSTIISTTVFVLSVYENRN